MHQTDSSNNSSFRKFKKQLSANDNLSSSKGFSSGTKAERGFELKRKMQPNLAMVDEGPELPPDPKVRWYGRYPETAVAVRLDYIEDPKDMLEELAEFIYKYAGNP